MDKWIGILIPLMASIGSALLTAMYITGKHVEKLQFMMVTMDEMADTIKEQSQVIAQLLERVAMLEGESKATRNPQ